MEFKRRLSRIEGTQSKVNAPIQVPPMATAAVPQVSNQQLLVIHLFQDKEKEEEKTKEDDVEERNIDEDSMPIGDLVKDHLTRHDNKS